ncbi:tetratricopeptide repeat protein [Pseudanabaena sp. PCC 6802]|uniref:tetratricopeptide repeat protein n=1 Tax=Pseudanabaena sp. PCC 6802 TaxID=118173 RepID=UPI00034D88F4|nr:tetratricopeptide repeat protein [Pseudanabaena sp. PCC 6802]
MTSNPNDNLDQLRQTLLERYEEEMPYYRETEGFDSQVECCQQVLPIFRQIGDRDGEIDTLCNLGFAYLSLYQYQEAIESYQSVLPILRQMNNQEEEANVLGNLGDTYRSLGEYQQAIEFYQQALPIFRQIGSCSEELKALKNQAFRKEALTLVHLGSIHLTLNQFEQAIEYYQQALPIFQQVRNFEIEPTALVGIASTCENLSQFEQAIEYYQKALNCYQLYGSSLEKANTLNSLGNVYNCLSQYSQAIKSYQQALHLYRQINSPQLTECIVLSKLGRIMVQQDQIEDALQHFSESVAMWKSFQTDQGDLAHTAHLSPVDEIVNDDYQLHVSLFQQLGLFTPRTMLMDEIADDYSLYANLLEQRGESVKAQQVLNLLNLP